MGEFYEIEYDSCPMEGVGKYVLKPHKIEQPEKEEIRMLFDSMRDIARKYRSPVRDYSRFYDRRIQQENARVFYKQAEFMKDFEDDYSQQIPFSSYFPYYQLLGYKQLRTYFSWRTLVRKGVVNKTSLSYAFLYIYELLNNIGVKTPQEGIDKLLLFWEFFKSFEPGIDKYMSGWIKDYYIYYGFSKSFPDFVNEHKLTNYYPKLAETKNGFSLFCSMSKYNIKKSVFFTGETEKLITDCFHYVLRKVKREFETAGISFDDSLFRPTRKLVSWKPFKDALFYSWYKQPDRRVVLSEDEIYICTRNEWTTSTTLTTEKGRQFVGYVMKRIEAELRRLTKYRYKITASLEMISSDTLKKLNKSGIFIEKIVPAAVEEFYREATKTVVKVNTDSLARIREEALKTQESLIVEEQISEEVSFQATPTSPKPEQSIFGEMLVGETSDRTDEWSGLYELLDETELLAIEALLKGDDLKSFSDEKGIMLEVLADGINEKAVDCIGDSILDEELTLYEDYKENVKRMVELL